MKAVDETESQDDSKRETSEMDSEQLKDGEVPEEEEKSGQSEEGVDPAGPKKEPMIVLVPQSDFVLGLGDLTGELMRNAINSVAAGNVDVCFTLLTFLQQVLEGFSKLDLRDAPKDMRRKIYTLRQSVRKVEDACYNINVRGSEM